MVVVNGIRKDNKPKAKEEPKAEKPKESKKKSK